MIHGYARCSTSEDRQDINRQTRELKKQGVERGWLEFEHGDTAFKEQQRLMLDAVNPGDTILYIIDDYKGKLRKIQVCSLISLLFNITHTIWAAKVVTKWTPMLYMTCIDFLCILLMEFFFRRDKIRYDATKYALGIWLVEKIEKQNNMALAPLHEYVKSSLIWEIERICLIKRKCHEYDQEWRMIRPAMFEQRSCVKMKPCKIIVGLRTPQYERRLIVSAATIAGIQEIHELYINDSDKLDSRPITI